jgi:inner membrane protein
MPTILTHPAVPLALALGLGRTLVSGRLLAAGVVASVLPDLDVIAFSLGVPYAADFGHRGFSHSVAFALLVALAGACLCRVLRTTPLRSLLFLFVAAVSHGVLDALTNGGLGVAFLWPWSGERFFAPVRVIEVAPIGISRSLSAKGAAVLWSEFLWLWLPFMAMASAIAILRRRVQSRLAAQRAPAFPSLSS